MMFISLSSSRENSIADIWPLRFEGLNFCRCSTAFNNTRDTKPMMKAKPRASKKAYMKEESLSIEPPMVSRTSCTTVFL